MRVQFPSSLRYAKAQARLAPTEEDTFPHIPSAGTLSDTPKLPMTTSFFQTIRPSRFNATKRQMLNAIGSALKHRKIDFHNAAELSDLVKAGQLDRITNFLQLEYSHEAN